MTEEQIEKIVIATEDSPETIGQFSVDDQRIADNAERALKAAKMVLGNAWATIDEVDDDDMCDAVLWLMHLCDARGWNWKEIAELAKYCYLDDVGANVDLYLILRQQCSQQSPSCALRCHSVCITSADTLAPG